MEMVSDGIALLSESDEVSFFMQDRGGHSGIFSWIIAPVSVRNDLHRLQDTFALPDIP
jgi:hypothetical protein